METNEIEDYLRRRGLLDLLQGKGKESTKVVYKTNWHNILAAAAGGAFAVLLFNYVTAEKINSSGNEESEMANFSKRKVKVKDQQGNITEQEMEIEEKLGDPWWHKALAIGGTAWITNEARKRGIIGGARAGIDADCGEDVSWEGDVGDSGW